MKRSIAIVGGGAAALSFASFIDTSKYDVTIYEKNVALGRKFLVAGDGGFNLTHGEQLDAFITRYYPRNFMDRYIRAFTNDDFRNWLKAIGIPTFVGSSNRVFPEEGIKPIEVLNAILEVLKSKGVRVETKHTWLGWQDQELLFDFEGTKKAIKADDVVFGLGGGSWKRTGSEGNWLNVFEEKGIVVNAFESANFAVAVRWPQALLSEAEGKALKNIVVKCSDVERAGECVITKFGLEGGAVYFVNPQVRKQLNKEGKAQLFIDFKPGLSKEEIERRLNAHTKSLAALLKRELNLNDLHLSMLKTMLTKEEYLHPRILAEKIKAFPVTVHGLAPIDEAISTVGGICLTEIAENFELKKLPNHFVIGEMLDWDAPTGGYLLQACFSMGWSLANFLKNKEAELNKYGT